MERRQPVSDRVRSRRDSDLPLERPVILPLDHGGRLLTRGKSWTKAGRCILNCQVSPLFTKCQKLQILVEFYLSYTGM